MQLDKPSFYRLEQAALAGTPLGEEEGKALLSAYLEEGRDEDVWRALELLSWRDEAWAKPLLLECYASLFNLDLDKEHFQRTFLLAQGGDRDALLSHAFATLLGRGVNPDPKRGKELLERAAEVDFRASLALGKCLSLGLCGIERDMSGAGQRFSEAAKSEDKNAVFEELNFLLLGRLFEGDGSIEENDETFGRLCELGRNGHLGAVRLVASILKGPLGRKKEALQWFAEASRMGDVHSREEAICLLVEGAAGDGEAKSHFDECRALAQDGHPEALCAMGRAYLEGKLADVDEELGVRFFILAAKTGIPSGSYGLGMCCLQGLGGLQQDAKSAKELFERAVSFPPFFDDDGRRLAAAELAKLESDNKKVFDLLRFSSPARPESLVALGDGFESGTWEEKGDFAAAATCYAEALKKGDLGARAPLAKLLLTGKGVKQNVPLGLSLLEEASKDGDPKAMVLLGDLHATGQLERSSMDEALRLYKEAHAKGSVDAAYKHGLCLGRLERPDAAARSFFKAAEEGHSGAAYELAVLLLAGEDTREDGADWMEFAVSRNEPGALDWIKEESAKGDPNACRLFAKFLEDKPGCGQMSRVLLLKAASELDDQKSCLTLAKLDWQPDPSQECWAWMEKAAKLGSVEAQLALGLAYSRGAGKVPYDAAGAAALLGRAAKAKSAKAAFELALLLRSRGGKHAANAVEWMKRAAGQGLADAQRVLGDWYLHGFADAENAGEHPFSFCRKAEPKRPYACRFAGEGGTEQKPALSIDPALIAGKGLNDSGTLFDRDPDFTDAMYFAKICYEFAARQGNVDAAYALSDLLLYGGDASLSEAKMWNELALQTDKAASENGDDGQKREAGWRLANFWLEEAKAKHDQLAADKARELLSRLAEGGFAKAQVLLANMMLAESPDEQALQKIKNYYVAAAQEGDTDAMMNLSGLLYSGRGCVKNRERAVVFLKEAAERGNAAAQHRLACIYQFGSEALEKNTGKALAWFARAAEQSHVPAMLSISELLWKLGGEDNKQKASVFLQKAAELGDAKAQFTVSLWLKNGIVLPKDEEAAELWLKASSDQGYAPAEFAYAHIVLSRAVGAERIEALKLLEHSAGQGYVKAQCHLGMLYVSGVDWLPQGPQTPKKGRELLRKATEQGDSEACFFYAGVLQHGIGGEKESKEGLRYLEQAAEGGFAPAQVALGHYLEEGGSDAFLKRKVDSFYWYEKAASQGDEEALERIKQSGAYIRQ